MKLLGSVAAITRYIHDRMLNSFGVCRANFQARRHIYVASAIDPTFTRTTPRIIIQINCRNSAIVQVANTYNDLGATITGPIADRMQQ